MAQAINLPAPSNFSPHGEPSAVSKKFLKWLTNFENFLLASNITADAQKKANLLYLMGEETYEIFETLTKTDDTYASAKAALTTHFSISKNVPFERHKFHMAEQAEGEATDQFITRLRSLAISCEFKDTDEQIRDALITKTRSSKLRQQLLMEKDLTLDKALEKAKILETATFNQKSIEQKQDGEINFLKKSGLKKQPAPSSQNKPENHERERDDQRHKKTTKKCNRCGFRGHLGYECQRSKDKICANCGKQGHFAKCCRSKKFNNSNVKNIGNVEDDEYLFANTNGVNPNFFKVKIGCSDVPILIDSGCNINIIDSETFQMIVPTPRLQASTNRIFPYGQKKPLKLRGKFTAKVKVTETGKQEDNVTFHVVQGSGGSILGDITAKVLDLLRVGPPSESQNNALSSKSNQPSKQSLYTDSPSKIKYENVSKSIEEVIQQFPSVFEGTGKLNDYELKLHIDESVTPVQQSVRRLPYHTRKRVSDELKRLQELDIIEPATGPTTWVSPIVPVTKNSGELRLCLDMRRPNKAVKREKHPIPKMEEIVSELQDAKVFSKIDLSEGYHQIALHPDSRDITTFITHEGLFRYKRLIFGISSAFEHFQKIIEQVIAGCEGAKNISDDIFIWGRDDEEHNRNLAEVLRRLHEAGLTVNLKKCEFGKTRMIFSGYTVTDKGILPDESKV